MWTICKVLHCLPNDDRLKSLTPIQAVWVLENMRVDSQEMSRSLKGVGESPTQEFETDTEDFDEAVRRMFKGDDN